MQTIKKLSPHLITKIAAGEVVERPGSVVKELIENAIDAGATFISIYLEEAGAKKIVIKDNGKGMHEDDVRVSFLPHTTSKLKSVDDLFSIKSFGFRGEALSTIAVVSHLTIRSRQTNTEFGFEIEVNEGELVHENPVGMPEGTEIIVEHLFNSMPARKKFLKDKKSELNFITTIISSIALSSPHIAFRLIHETNTILDIPSTEKLQERFEALSGSHVVEHSLPISFETIYGKIHGFVGKPQLAGRNRQHQYIFINNRFVTDEVVTKTVVATFGSLIEPRSFPLFAIFLSLPYENVDVNVHPRKEQVAFAHPKEVETLVAEALQKVFKENDLTYTDPNRRYDIHDEYLTLRDRSMDMHMAKVLRDTITPWNVKPQNEEIIQLHNVYLIAETYKGILMIDQHAAHERILFEQFKEAFYAVQNKLEIVVLSEPVVFNLPTADSVSLTSQLEIFQKLGFDIEPFGQHSFKLCAVPILFKKRDYRKLIIEVLADVQSGSHKKLDRETERTLAYLACRTAIKAGDVLIPEERKELVTKLLATEGVYTCPHGRPTHIEVSLNELDRMFKRK